MNSFLQIEEIDLKLLLANPVAWLEAFKEKPGTILLDSALYDERLGRWSFLAIDPVHLIHSKAGRTWIDGKEMSDDPFHILQELSGRYTIEDDPALPPFATGIAGYFGYDFKRHIENVPEHAHDNPAMPDLMLGFYDLVLAIDHKNARAFFLGNAKCNKEVRHKIRWAKERLLSVRSFAPRQNVPILARPDLERAKVEQMIRSAIDYIEAGDIYQANITHRFSVDLPDSFDRLALYDSLRRRNPAAFAAYLDFRSSAVLSSSPERFLRLRDGKVEARPIKGTRPRSQDPIRDRELAKELLASEKDHAENLMIVDLLRNDLSRECVIGSVKVPVLCGLESYATVHHLVSVVTGDLLPEKNAIDLLRAAFPGGSVTGAPKIRAMEIIAELEPTWRGPYCGAIGYLGANGTMDANIVIRSYCIEDNRLSFQVGGGIVADSNPQEEYEESLVKAKALFEVLAQKDADQDRSGHAA